MLGKVKLVLTIIALAAMPFAALVAAPIATRVAAQSGGGYDLTWNDVEGSGAVSTGSGYELFGVSGQHDAGPMSGSGYTLDGGFLVPVTYRAYVPIVRRP